MYTIYNRLLVSLYLNFFPCTDWIWISTCFSWLKSNTKLDRFMHILVHCCESNKFCFSLAFQKTWKGNIVSQGNLNNFDFYSDRKKLKIFWEKKNAFIPLELFWFLRHFTFWHLKKYIWNPFQSLKSLQMGNQKSFNF